MDLAGLLTVEHGLAFLTLTVLEVVLGIDNIVFIAILAGKLPPERQAAARKLGLLAAMVTRILLLFGISMVMKLTSPLFTLFEGASFSHVVTGKDLVLIVGGLFLLGKATFEIHERLEGQEHGDPKRVAHSFAGVIVQIMLLDIVFSIDSVITAVGLANRIEIMVAAVVVSVLFMMAMAGPVSGFIEKHPTLKMLALSFLLLIGVMLVAEGSGVHVPKGYIYFAMGFSLMVELLNMKLRKKGPPVKLREPTI